MENLKSYIVIYLTAINIIGFIITGIDKYLAIHKKWRVAERRFLSLAVFGGGLGVYIGCLAFKHKTQHRKFMIGIPAICIAEAVIVLLIMVNF